MSEIAKDYYNTEMLARDVRSLIYVQGKSRILNVLETQYENDLDPRLRASARIVEDILTSIGKNAENLIADNLGEWAIKISYAQKCETCKHRQPVTTFNSNNPKTLCSRNCNKENGFMHYEGI